MAVVVVMPGPDSPPDPLGSGSTPSFLRSSEMAHLPITPYLCTDEYARLIRTFHCHSVILPTSPPVLLRHETQREVVIESLKADCEVRTGRPPGKYAGREGLKRSVAKQRASSSDLHISIEEQIAQGDKVVTWVIGSGTHDRERFLGL